MFKKLAGMTGTAKTEEAEFQGIYDLDVVEIPTNMPMRRTDFNDVVYATEAGKFRAVVEEIAKVHSTGQPILVGTISVEKSERLSEMLSRKGIAHEVLNAKLHAKEAEIVAQAGKLKTVTIATNMAGRGTDIILGGNPEFMARRELRQNGADEAVLEEAVGHAETQDEQVLELRTAYNRAFENYKKQTDAEHEKVVALGGLHIIGTERHESRRIDNQLRGRSGRQGDPGSTRFYVSLEDELMLRFGADRVKAFMERISPDDEIPIDVGIITKQIESAQKRVESHNFEIRKNVLQYDDIMNKQREIIYGQRRRVLMGEDIKNSVFDMIRGEIQKQADTYCPADVKPAEWDIAGLAGAAGDIIGRRPSEIFPEEILAKPERDTVVDCVMESAEKSYAEKEQNVTEAGIDMREVERVVLLKSVDSHWMDHIDAMDQLKQGIGLRAYGQKDPVMEYRNEGFEMFDEMVAGIQAQTARMLYHVSVKAPQQREQLAKPIEPAGDSRPEPARKGQKVGRNDPCPCGSGKKYKNCCGKQA
jgi:preprotein translocase subunit SecA